ncbi:transcriptional regulator, TetR family [Actinobacteria bacterium IMCC26207]|nr:transcriptional regulator, TetR family [Actinobacteria bacterium IMCC26207]
MATSPSTPTRARGRATKAKLMTAGVAVFSDKGFRAARVDDIVKRARISHGTFYLYFSSKDDLFEQLVAQVAEELKSLTESLPIIRQTQESRDGLEQWLVSFIELYSTYGPLIRSWTEAERGGVSTQEDVLGTVADALALKVKIRKRKDFDPRIASLALLAMVERVNYFSVTGQVDEEAENLSRTLADIMLDAFFA